MTKAESDSCTGKVEEKLQEVTASLAADIEISVDASSKSDVIFTTKNGNERFLSERIWEMFLPVCQVSYLVSLYQNNVTKQGIILLYTFVFPPPPFVLARYLRKKCLFSKIKQVTPVLHNTDPQRHREN